MGLSFYIDDKRKFKAESLGTWACKIKSQEGYLMAWDAKIMYRRKQNSIQKHGQEQHLI